MSVEMLARARMRRVGCGLVAAVPCGFMYRRDGGRVGREGRGLRGQSRTGKVSKPRTCTWPARRRAGSSPALKSG